MLTAQERQALKDWCEQCESWIQVCLLTIDKHNSKFWQDHSSDSQAEKEQWKSHHSLLHYAYWEPLAQIEAALTKRKCELRDFTNPLYSMRVWWRLASAELRQLGIEPPPVPPEIGL